MKQMAVITRTFHENVNANKEESEGKVTNFYWNI